MKLLLFDWVLKQPRTNFLGEFGKKWSDVCVWYPEGLQAFVNVRKISPFANLVVHDNERVSGIPHRETVQDVTLLWLLDLLSVETPPTVEIITFKSRFESMPFESIMFEALLFETAGKFDVITLEIGWFEGSTLRMGRSGCF